MNEEENRKRSFGLVGTTLPRSSSEKGPLHAGGEGRPSRVPRTGPGIARTLTRGGGTRATNPFESGAAKVNEIGVIQIIAFFNF